MLYFESPHLLVYWEDWPQCVHTEWHGFVTNDNLREGLIKAMELAKTHSATRWVSDLRDMHVYDMSDQEWIIKEFVPALRAIGIEKMAIIKPTLPATLMSISRIVKHSDPDLIQTSFFADLPAAYEWLAGEQATQSV